MVLQGVELWHWCVTQATIALSSAEAENRAAMDGLTRGLYVKNLLAQQGVQLELRVFTDSTACIGHASRQGNGKRMRHLEVHDLWIQDVIKNKQASIHKVNGQENPADLFTKHLPRENIIRNMSRLGFRLIDQQGKELGNKDVDRSWQVGEDYEDQDDQGEGIEASIAICEAAYGSWINQIRSREPSLTRETCVESQASECDKSSPIQNVEKSGEHVVSSSSATWTDVVKKNTITHSTTTSATRVPLTSRPTCAATEVRKIMQEAAERAAKAMIREVRGSV